MCLGPLTPCVTSGHSDVLLQLLGELTRCLPGGSQAPESPVLLWQAGLALGSVLARLWHHGFAHTAGPQVRTLDSGCLLYTSPSPRDQLSSRMPSSA